VAGLVITIGGYGFIRAVTSVDASAVKEQDDRIDSLETRQAVVEEKLDMIIKNDGDLKEQLNDIEGMIQKLQDK
jgi:peptidoglycan hydrolase CwlO-like protein